MPTPATTAPQEKIGSISPEPVKPDEAIKPANPPESPAVENVTSIASPAPPKVVDERTDTPPPPVTLPSTQKETLKADKEEQEFITGIGAEHKK